MFSCLLVLGLSLLTIQQGPSPASTPQPVSSATWATNAANDYTIHPNITYLTAENYEAKLDVYRPLNNQKPVPTVVYFHGGGWVGGTRSANVMEILPYLEMGWAVVNVDYRLASVSLAPAAVEDCRCALKWVITHAEQYKFDVKRIVLSGRSAGGHLALTTGFLATTANLDWRCYYDEAPMDLKVAAIVNWYGITDVTELISGPSLRTWAASWLGPNADRIKTAELVSPLNSVRKGVPPVLTIHGDADPVVPYSQAVRLHRALNGVGTPNKLITVPRGNHGGFSSKDTAEIYAAIRSFLKEHLH